MPIDVTRQTLASCLVSAVCISHCEVFEQRTCLGTWRRLLFFILFVTGSDLFTYHCAPDLYSTRVQGVLKQAAGQTTFRPSHWLLPINSVAWHNA